MLISILFFIAIVALVYFFKKKNPGITLEQETVALKAKAKAEEAAVVSDVKSDAAKVETAVITETKTVETEVKKVV